MLQKCCHFEPEENGYVRDIEKLISQKIEVVKNNPFPQTEKPMTSAEKTIWEKEKLIRKKEQFAARNQRLGRTKSFRYK